MPRPPLRNNPRLIILLILPALALFLGVQILVHKSGQFSPDFLASVFLYGLTVLNIALILILVFLVGRNVVRALMERRRKALGARFRMRLVLVFLLMAVAPALLLLVVGSDLIHQTVDRWFNVDVERILSSSQTLGMALKQSLLDRSRAQARVLAREVEDRGLLLREQTRLRATMESRARELGIDALTVLGRQGALISVTDPRFPPEPLAGDAPDTLAEQALQGKEAESSLSVAAGDLLRVAAPVRAPDGTVTGVVIVSTLLPASVAAEASEVQERYTKFRQAQALRGPIKAVYLSLYLLPALLILFGAVWLSLYLARRITTPLRLVAEGAERIAAGGRGVRVDFPAGDEEFSALIASFNRMSERLARSEEEVEHSRAGLTRKNTELEERRRLMETVLETVGTGVVVVDAEAAVTAINAAAAGLLELRGEAVGLPLGDLLQGPGRSEVLGLLARVLAGRAPRQERAVLLPGEGGERHLKVVVVSLAGAPGTSPGAVVVLDDLTPHMRAQKVAAWGEVAKKLAHEIKNPLTPIQLSAQRVRKAYLKQAPDFEKVLGECTEAIVQEVEALKNLVDEFAHYARLPAMRLSPSSLHEVVDQALSLYDGLYAGMSIERRLSSELPSLHLDADQMKRVLINLVDNAIDATRSQGRVVVATEYDRGEGRVRLSVADDGPGIRAEDREKLFVPHFSTKKGGSGLGLSIASRIVEEHQGVLRAEDNPPHGARFVVDLPA